MKYSQLPEKKKACNFCYDCRWWPWKNTSTDRCTSGTLQLAHQNFCCKWVVQISLLHIKTMSSVNDLLTSHLRPADSSSFWQTVVEYSVSIFVRLFLPLITSSDHCENRMQFENVSSWTLEFFHLSGTRHLIGRDGYHERLAVERAIFQKALN